MPGPLVHLIVQQRLAGTLGKLGPPAQPLAKLLADDPCSRYAAFGSVGPDFLFFSLKEYGTPLDELVNFTFEAYDALEPLRDFYALYVEPVEQALESAVTTLDQAMFRGLIADLKATVDLIRATAVAKVSTQVTGKVDLFMPFFPKIQQGAPEDKWYYFDFLHYRRTGRFASTMWKLAGGDPDLRRYVLGYVSHIGTDVVGHPFVNAVTGGPYRTHWHRHKLVENWMDAWSRRHYSDLAGVKACLKLGSGDAYAPHAISGSYYYRLVEFEDSRLPQKLRELFAKALQSTYGDMPHPEMLNGADVDAAYRLWLAWFRRSTSVGSAVKPVPVDPPGTAAGALFNSYVAGSPPYPGGGGAPAAGPGWQNILQALVDFATWVGQVMSYTLDWAWANAAGILALPHVEAMQTLKWLLYQVRKGAWEVYDGLRFALVLGGYLFPEPEDLDREPWGKALLTPAHAHLSGGAAADAMLYPRAQEVHELAGTTEHHLVYPATGQELLRAEPAPALFDNLLPDAFISHPWVPDQLAAGLLAATEPYGGPAATHSIDEATEGTPQLGNALDFSARLAADHIASLPNFNLDGDRGYGWKTWRADPIADDPAVAEPGPQVDPVYIDA
ncbi:MAG TPA: hypothetical protein VF746_14565 [Longimicrobium sp.]|jgi:hypothetical protein